MFHEHIVALEVVTNAGIYLLMRPDLPCACDLLRRATRAVSAIYDEVLMPQGLRATQFSVLNALHRGGPLPITELAAAVGLDRSTMGRNLHPLERLGLVRVGVGEDDRRLRLASLTSRGEEIFRAALPRWRSVQKKVVLLVDYDAILDIPRQVGTLQKRGTARRSKNG